MDISTKVRKKHKIKLDNKELQLLVYMLKQYDRAIASKLPDGIPTDELSMIQGLNYAANGSQYFRGELT